MDLTKRQKEILDFIVQYIREHGFAPSNREIGESVGLTGPSAVKHQLEQLERKRCIHRKPGTARGLWLRGGQQYPVPLVGHIAAGQPLRLPENDFSITDYETIMLNGDVLRPQPGLFALKVQGKSMIDALIDDGDTVIVRRQNHAETGEMVAAWLIEEGETTLKKYYREKGRVRLQPANPEMEPIYVHPSNLRIQGKVVGVIRQLS